MRPSRRSTRPRTRCVTFRSKFKDNAWDNSDNWTLGREPGRLYDVFVTHSSGSVHVTGPSADTTIESLTVGGDHADTLDVQPNTTITTLDDLTVKPNGTLGFATASSAGRISSGGDANLAGTLNVVCVDGTVGQEFTLIDAAGSISGTFDAVLGGTATYTGGEVTVTLNGFPDLTGDGNVDAADVSAFTAALASEQATAQIAVPFDTFDIFDLTVYLNAIADDCNAQ